MTTKVKIWQIKEKQLLPIKKTLEEEGRKEQEDLEEWIKSYPKILGGNLLIIGNQIKTKSGPLDFLAIDENGNTVIVELKRGKIPRKALAQAIDYASDIESWNIDELDEHCKMYTKTDLIEFIIENFPLKDINWDDISINQTQRILLVGTYITESLERMIHWLSENYNVLINAEIITYGKTANGEEIIASTSIIPEEIGEEHSKKKNKKITPKTLDDYRNRIKIQNLKAYFIAIENKINTLSEDIEEIPRVKYIVFKYKGTAIAQLRPRKDFFDFFAFGYSEHGPKDFERIRINNPNENIEDLLEKIKRYLTHLNT